MHQCKSLVLKFACKKLYVSNPLQCNDPISILEPIISAEVKIDMGLSCYVVSLVSKNKRLSQHYYHWLDVIVSCTILVFLIREPGIKVLKYIYSLHTSLHVTLFFRKFKILTFSKKNM